MFRSRAKLALTVALLILLAVFLWNSRSVLNWPDRRPIGALFLADYTHASPSNPRGWFNSPGLDTVSAGGAARLRKMLLAYADRSIAILKQTRSQGMIVWDLEGEQYPQKTTYIGDPRQLDRLAPEMAAAADEFFARYRAAGLRVGLTIRPQQIVFDTSGRPLQNRVWNYDELLLAKLDYARKRWGATLFYVDSNPGPFRLDDIFRLRRIARMRPDVLLIPEHHQLLYYGFSAPYAETRRGSMGTPGILRFFYPRSFEILNIGDGYRRGWTAEETARNGDVMLFPAWFCGRECRLLTDLQQP